jgi:putative holliday junction resolvase
MRFKRAMRLTGIDVGTKRIGVALSDETGTLAQGRCVVSRTSDNKAVADIVKLIKEFSAVEVVVGLPLNMNGTKGPRASDAQVFGEKLAGVSGVKVVYWDERLSTKEVEDIMIASSVRREKRRALLDKMAAQVILQGYIDSR